ncbi:hypothetical protein Aperf_G00000099882 [Anoplocephala perfoliata]
MKCSYCYEDVPEDVYHEHLQKCLTVMEKMRQNSPSFQSSIQECPVPSLVPPERARSAFTPSQTSGSTYYCRQCEKDFFSKTEFADHLKSIEHNSPIRANSYLKRYNSASSVSPSMDLLGMQSKTASNAPLPLTPIPPERTKYAASPTQPSGPVYHCRQCDKDFPNKMEFTEHLQSMEHKNPLRGSSNFERSEKTSVSLSMDLPGMQSKTASNTLLQPTLIPPEHTRCAGTPSQQSGSEYQYEKDFLSKSEFTEHSKSMEHNSPIIANSYLKRRNSAFSVSPTMDLLGMLLKTASNESSPLPLKENLAAQTNRPMDQNEIRLIVREEIAKYLRQLLQIVESDICTNGSIP